jgi:hypothetical protein
MPGSAGHPVIKYGMAVTLTDRDEEDGKVQAWHGCAGLACLHTDRFYMVNIISGTCLQGHPDSFSLFSVKSGKCRRRNKFGLLIYAFWIRIPIFCHKKVRED